MNRRSVLSMMGVAVGGGLAGCSVVDGGDDLPEFKQTSVRELDRACAETVDDTATISFGNSGKRVDISGRFGVRDISWELMVRTKLDNTDKQKAILHIDQYAQNDANTEERDCSGSIDYEASVSLTKAPSEVVVIHKKEEGGDHESRTWPETVATSSP